MYQEFYGFRDLPFRITPDPRFLYRNSCVEEASAALKWGIESRKGFVSLVGEAGTGKTTLLRHLLDSLGPQVRTVLLLHPTVSFDEILEYILSELGIPVDGGRKLVLLQRLNEFLLEHTGSGGNVALLIDEAQDLEDKTLEELRLLSNLETGSEKILQILLAGQPELEAKLAQPNLRQLRQRIALHLRLKPLSPGEVSAYVRTRLTHAGARDVEIFDPDALVRIAQVTRGIPRIVNVLCDACLVAGFAQGRPKVDTAIVDEAWADFAHFDQAIEDGAPAPTIAGTVFVSAVTPVTPPPVSAAPVVAPVPAPVIVAPPPPPPPPPAPEPAPAPEPTPEPASAAEVDVPPPPAPPVPVVLAPEPEPEHAPEFHAVPEAASPSASAEASTTRPRGRVRPLLLALAAAATLLAVFAYRDRGGDVGIWPEEHALVVTTVPPVVATTLPVAPPPAVTDTTPPPVMASPEPTLPPTPSAPPEAAATALVESFRRAYEARDVDRLLDLFAPDATQNGQEGRDAIAPEYRQAFGRMIEVQYALSDITVTTTGLATIVHARFAITYRETDSDPATAQGTATWRIEQRDDVLRITDLTYAFTTP